MQAFPAPAAALVAELTAAATRAPQRAVAFQGAPGANSHVALMELFPQALPLPCYAFEDALDAVRDGAAHRAVIPIENSLHGRVADIHFLLPESGLVITAEHFLGIRHCLIGLPGVALGDVTQAMSHPQALGQCRRWLRGHGIRPIAFADTAAAVAEVAVLGERGVAALAPAASAALYGLELIAADVADAADNVTRFVVLAQGGALPERDVRCMTSLVFEVRSVPAALYKALGGFATNGVNMTKLESYQPHGGFAATEFYADIEGHPEDEGVARALEELRFHSKRVRLLGTYPQARHRIEAASR